VLLFLRRPYRCFVAVLTTHAEPDPADSYPHLYGLPLAHPVQATGNFEISLLVGADSYVQDRGNGPTAVESRIGYHLSGPL